MTNRLRDLARDLTYATLRQGSHLVRGRSNASLLDGHLDPVLLLPGVYETWQFLRPIATRLHELGHPIHVVPGFGYNRAAIPDAAALAAAYVEKQDLKRVIIVAHSKGGLIGKQIMLFGDPDGRIAKLIAVATPFSGSSLARYMLSPALRAFMPTNAVLTRLGASGDVNARIVSIYGTFDPQIPGGSHLDGATNIQLPVSGHFLILKDPTVIAEIESAVAGVD